MNDFDKFIRNNIDEKYAEIPESVKDNIEQVLNSLPEKEHTHKKAKILPQIAAVAACFVFITLFVFPNISVAYAHSLEKVPVLGNIIKVVTIRNYFYDDGNHEMNIDVPQIEGEDINAGLINKDVDDLTNALMNQFYKDLEVAGNNGYGSIRVDYETTANTGNWFTLKLSVIETAASSNNYFVFYHIDKNQGKIIKLKDLFTTDDFSDILVTEIKRQMQEQMNADENVKYWLNDSEIGEDIIAVTPEHNFYWNNDGNLVIVFNKYEVAPGYMGTPEFVIEKSVIRHILKGEYKNITP